MFFRPRMFGGPLVAAAAAMVAAPAFALVVQPVVIDLKTSGQGSSAAIVVTNDRNRPVTVEVTVNKLSLPQDGPPVLTADKGDDFLIFPPLATLQPGKTQVIRVRWVGAPTLAESQTYMFATSELPIDQISGSGVQLLYSIQSLVTVTSAALKPDVHIIGVDRAEQPNLAPAGEQTVASVPGIKVTFQNDGSAIDYVSHHRLKFSVAGSKWSKVLDVPDVSKSVGLGLLTPNSKRDLFFALNDVPPSGTLQASLEDAPQR
jgi:P pilus assembly chaperone PapD